MYPSQLSALALLPGYDKFGYTVFDPMHSLLEGACKTYFSKVILFGVHGSGGETEAVAMVRYRMGHKEPRTMRLRSPRGSWRN